MSETLPGAQFLNISLLEDHSLRANMVKDKVSISIHTQLILTTYYYYSQLLTSKSDLTGYNPSKNIDTLLSFQTNKEFLTYLSRDKEVQP